jgi:hypothetical protein
MTNDQIPMTNGMPAALVIGAWSLENSDLPTTQNQKVTGH